MSDVVDAETTTAPEVPQESPSPANDPTPVETPATSEPVIVPPSPEETPVIHTPTEMPQSPQAAAAPFSIKKYAYAALEKIRFRKRAKLDKILLLAAKKNSIKNDDVEKLLKVSDATATNYLSQLVREGSLKKTGIRAGTVYEPI